jgi:cytochrome c-type biogenesis protein CcmH
MSQSQIEANVAALAKRLEANPSDLQGWIMLARSYSILEQYDESSKAYEKAVALKPRDAELITNYALALAMANGRQFEGKPSELIKQALRIDPENPNVLGLAGGAAFERKNYKEAIVHWDKLLTKIPADSDMAKAVSQRLVEAKSLLSGATEE